MDGGESLIETVFGRATPRLAGSTRRRALAGLGSLLAFGLAVAVLLRVTPVPSTAPGVVITTDAMPIRVAGRSPAFVVGYLDLRTARLYATGRTVLVLAVGALGCVRGGRAAIVGIGLGITAAGTLVALTGCGCGTGSTATLWELALR